MQTFYKNLCLALSMLLVHTVTFAAAPPASESDLLKGANVVVNEEETTFTVNGATSATTRVRVNMTILNENGKDRAKMYVTYDKLRKVDMLKGTSYDKAGKKIKSLKSSDIADVGAVSNSSLFDDHRVKIGNLTHTSYPYTVEFEYQTTTTNMLFYYTWAPVDQEGMAVRKSVFQVKMPTGTKLRFHESNMKEKVKQETTPTHTVYTWQANNLAPIEREPYGPSFAEIVPLVRTAPADFEVQGYKGNMESWESYGIWINKLNEGRDKLPDATKQKLQTMVAKVNDPAEKVKAIYNYLQQNTRYVSIQLGIGGWQPFEASFVDSKGYGDCKALTNYTQAMLKAVGINSHQALIRAGENEPAILANFPSSQFNHVVLCVPMPQDTLWLECTSQIAAAGYSGSFTGGRQALLITPEGGKLVNTPHYKASDNVQKRSIQLKLDDKGNGIAKVTTLLTGEQSETHDHIINNMKPEDQRKWLYQQVKLPSFDINKFAFSQQKDRVPAVTEQLELSLRQVATLSGKRIFITPNLMNKWNSSTRQIEKRQFEVVRGMSFLDVDTVEIEMPVGYTLEHQPKDTQHTTKFGELKVNTKVDGQKLTYIRSLQMYKGRYSSEAYAEMVEFINNIVKADSQQVVFVKNIQ